MRTLHKDFPPLICNCMDHKGEEVVYQSTREAVEVSVFLQAFLEDLEAKGLDVHVAGYSAWDPALSVLPQACQD